MAIHAGKLTVSISVDTEGNPNEVMGKFLDLIDNLDQEALGVTWESCAWDWSTITRDIN